MQPEQFLTTPDRQNHVQYKYSWHLPAPGSRENPCMVMLFSGNCSPRSSFCSWNKGKDGWFLLQSYVFDVKTQAFGTLLLTCFLSDSSLNSLSWLHLLQTNVLPFPCFSHFRAHILFGFPVNAHSSFETANTFAFLKVFKKPLYVRLALSKWHNHVPGTF